MGTRSATTNWLAYTSSSDISKQPQRVALHTEYTKCSTSLKKVQSPQAIPWETRPYPEKRLTRNPFLILQISPALPTLCLLPRDSIVDRFRKEDGLTFGFSPLPSSEPLNQKHFSSSLWAPFTLFVSPFSIGIMRILIPTPLVVVRLEINNVQSFPAFSVLPNFTPTVSCLNPKTCSDTYMPKPADTCPGSHNEPRTESELKAKTPAV